MEEKARAIALGVVRRLHEAGHTAYFAGGSVRDDLLGLAGPRGDYDVATSATPEQVRALFPRNVPVGAQFGVILVIENDVQVEVATFRADDAYVDGRRPQSVRFTTPREDAERRDFTINGMFYDPTSGEILDYVGGRADLERRIVRAIGDPRKRFAEDKLRLIRGVRFAARLGFEIEPATARAIREMAPEIRQVSPERIGDEIVKILIEGSSRRGFELLSETGLLAEILPEIEAMKGVEQGKDHHPEGDVFVHTMLALGGLDGSPVRAERLAQTDEDSRGRLVALAFGTLFHDVAKPECRQAADGKITFYGHCERGAEMALAICRRLRRANVIGERVAWLVKSHLRVLSAPEMRLSTLKKLLREDGIEELLELCRIDAEASSGNLTQYQFCREALGRLSKEAMRPPALLSGHDLIELGHQPGPGFKEILAALEELQLEGEIQSRDEALSFVQRRFPVR